MFFVRSSVTEALLTVALLFSCSCLVQPVSQPFSIQEPSTYEPKLSPNNFQLARQSLGYDSFQRVPTKNNAPNPTKKFPWEQFDTPEVRFNF